MTPLPLLAYLALVAPVRRVVDAAYAGARALANELAATYRVARLAILAERMGLPTIDARMAGWLRGNDAIRLAIVGEYAAENLSEGQAARLLGVDRVTLRGWRLDAEADVLANLRAAKGRQMSFPPSPPDAHRQLAAKGGTRCPGFGADGDGCALTPAHRGDCIGLAAAMTSDEVFADCNGANGGPAPVADPAELDADERAMVEGPRLHFDAFLLDTEGSASRPVCDGKVGPSDSLTVFRHNFLAAPNRCAGCVAALGRTS